MPVQKISVQTRREKNRFRLVTREEEDVFYRRNSLRKMNQIQYREGDDEQDEEEYKSEEEQEDEEGEEGPSTQNSRKDRIQEKGFFFVTCGIKKGVLDKEKLRRSEECIESEGQSFTPTDFEKFGGKGASKNWKLSIFHDNKPLKYFLDKRLLTTGGYHRSTRPWKKKKREEENEEEKENRGEVYVVDSGEDMSNDEEETGHGDEDDNKHPDSEELVLEREVHVLEDTSDHGEDEEMPAAADEDPDSSQNVCKEMEMQLKISPSAKCALHTNPKVSVKKLPEIGLHSSCRYHQLEDETLAEASRKHCDLEINHPSIPAAQDDSDITDISDGDREMETTYEYSPRRRSAADCPSPHSTADTVNRDEETGSTRNHTAELGSSPRLLTTGIRDETKEEEDGEMETGLCGRYENICKKNEHLDESMHEESQDFITTNVKDVATSTSPIDVKGSCLNADAVTQAHVLNAETSLPETGQASGSSYSRRRSSTSFIRPNLATSRLQQLKQTKIKKQLKVLQLQEEYYSLKLKSMKEGK